MNNISTQLLERVTIEEKKYAKIAASLKENTTLTQLILSIEKMYTLSIDQNGIRKEAGNYILSALHNKPGLVDVNICIERTAYL